MLRVHGDPRDSYPRTDPHRPTHRQHTLVHPRPIPAASTDRGDGGTLHRRGWRRARVPELIGAGEGAIHRRSLQPGVRGAPVYERRFRTLYAWRAYTVPLGTRRT